MRGGGGGYYLFNASRSALHNYLHRVAAVATAGEGRVVVRPKSKKKDPRPYASAQRPRFLREASADRCTYVCTNAETQPVCTNNSTHIARTCTQRGIFARFSVLTVSACLLGRLGSAPSAPLFSRVPISISNSSAVIPAWEIALPSRFDSIQVMVVQGSTNNVNNFGEQRSKRRVSAEKLNF